MKVVINGIDYTEAARCAYAEARHVLDLPKIEDVQIVVNGHKNGQQLGNGGKVGGQYRIELSEQSIITNFVDELDIAVPALMKHEAIHVHQVHKHLECGHDGYFRRCLEKLGLPNDNRFSTTNIVQEERKMKSKLNIGGINIDMLKQAAGLMNMSFEEYLEKTGMKAVIETAEAEQTKTAEKEKAEKEKAEFELLKAKVETFKSAREMRINTLKSEIEEAFEKCFNEDERGKVELKVDFTLKVNVKGAAKREGGTRTNNGQSKWRLFVDDVEIDGVPGDSEFTTVVDECINKWNWLLYELKKARKEEISTTVFSHRISLAGVAATYKPRGTKKWDWKEAIRSGKIAERMSVDLDKVVRIEEVEKESV